MSTRTTDRIAFWIFPATLGSCLALNVWLITGDLPTLFAAWIPVVLGGIAVLGLEQVFPARGEWRPRVADVKADASFMAVVQVLLPEMLTFAFAVTVLDAVRGSGLALVGWWPSQAHHFVQLVLALLLVSFARYWLHRAAHAWRPLWVLHAVHHAPKRLYWVNVARAHPLEKLIQFLVETFPLMVLGINESVLASYFVLFAITGFLDHCNIRMHNPMLSYVFSTGDLHRWHHSLDLKEAHCNFGNLLSVWDLIFGTRYLPADREVGELGIPYRGYPQGFLAQMVSPFRKALYGREPAITGAVAEPQGARS